MNHLKEIKKLLFKYKIDALLISSPSNIIYLTNFSGFSKEDRDAFLLITQTEAYIFTHGIYKEAVEKCVVGFTLIEMTREQPLKNSLRTLLKKHNVLSMGFEPLDISVSEYTMLKNELGASILKPTSSLIESIRLTKDISEIEMIKKACLISDKAFTTIINRIKTGISEKDLALELELFIRKGGASLSFPIIVAFGSHASLPHHQPTDRTLKKNEFVLLDFGVMYKNYCSDMTRTVFVGKANEEQKKMYETVRVSQQKAIDFINRNSLILNPNGKQIKASDVDKIARDYIVSQGYPPMPHSLGHGIGIEVHEIPRITPNSSDVLANGMVFSIEPGIYIPNVGGVRIEDLFAIEKNLLTPLTTAPKQLLEL